MRIYSLCSINFHIRLITPVRTVNGISNPHPLTRLIPGVAILMVAALRRHAHTRLPQPQRASFETSHSQPAVIDKLCERCQHESKNLVPARMY